MSENILVGPKVTDTIEYKTLGQFLFHYGKRHADKICQINMNTNEQESYSSVLQRSTRVALAMQELGITSKDIVVLCCSNSIHNIIPILAAIYLGAKVNNIDPSMPIKIKNRLLNLTLPSMLFVDETCVDDIEESIREINLATKIVVLGSSTKHNTLDDFLKPQEKEEEFVPVQVDENEIALMFFTSGTTGLPKAICHSHFSFLNCIATARYLDVDLHFSPFYWMSAMLILGGRFLSGGTRVFGTAVIGDQVLKCIDKYKITSVFMSPVYSYELTNVANPHQYNTDSLRRFMTSGNPMGIIQIKKLKAVFKNADIIPFYGMTEAGLISLLDGTKEELLMKTKVGSCGTVIAGTKIKIVDPSTGAVLGPNQKGEIHVKNSCLMVGYYQKDSSHEFDADGFLKTGDLAYYDNDHYLYFVDRYKAIFKYKSFHISPSTIEKALLNYPGIKEAFVFGLPMGEEGFHPAACIVLQAGQTVDLEEILEFIAQRVLDCEKLRGGITILDRLPKTPSGKVMREDVRNMIINSRK